MNHGLSSQRFSFKISILKVEINAKSATKFKLITEARVKLNNTSVKDVVNGLFGKDLPENMEVEVVIKRTNRKENVKDYIDPLLTKEGANKQVISSQADSLIKISRIWADFFPANTSNQPI